MLSKSEIQRMTERYSKPIDFGHSYARHQNKLD